MVCQNLPAGDFNSTNPSSGLHSAATKLPLARKGRGPPQSTREVYRDRPPRQSRPRPRPVPLRSQALHALLRQQLPELLTAQAQPLGLGSRAVGEKVLGAMRALGQLLGPRAGGEEFTGAAEGGDAGSESRGTGRRTQCRTPVPFPAPTPWSL